LARVPGLRTRRWKIPPRGTAGMHRRCCEFQSRTTARKLEESRSEDQDWQPRALSIFPQIHRGFGWTAAADRAGGPVAVHSSLRRPLVRDAVRPRLADRFTSECDRVSGIRYDGP